MVLNCHVWKYVCVSVYETIQFSLTSLRVISAVHCAEKMMGLGEVVGKTEHLVGIVHSPNCVAMASPTTLYQYPQF